MSALSALSAWLDRARASWRFRLSVVLVVCATYLLIWDLVPPWRHALFPVVPLLILPLSVWFDILATTARAASGPPFSPPMRRAALASLVLAWATALLLLLHAP